MLVRTSPKESMFGLLNCIKKQKQKKKHILQFQDNFRLQSTHERYTYNEIYWFSRIMKGKME
jgi:hypothetical protein